MIRKRKTPFIKKSSPRPVLDQDYYDRYYQQFVKYYATVKVFYTANYLEEWPRLKEVPGDACFDLRAAIPEKTFIRKGETKIIPLGVIFEFSAGKGLLILPRSGLTSKGFLVNTSVIDPSYRGEIGAIITNICHTSNRVFIEPGDRIAQGMIIHYIAPEFMPVNDPARLNPTWRGENGFGHSGIK